MKYFISILSCFFFITTCIKAQNIDSIFIDAHVTKLINAKKYTLEVAGLMPDEKYSFKPSANEMDFGAQLLHISANLCWLSSSYLSIKKNPLTEADSKVLSKKDIILVVEKAYDFAINVIQNINTKSLGDTVDFFAGPKTKLQIINLLQDHQTHHRGQLLVYLRLNIIKPPEYVGW